MFSFIKEKLSRVYATITQKLALLFQKGTIDEAWLKDLERVLISGDVGSKITRQIVETMRQQMVAGTLKTGEDAHIALKEILIALLPKNTAPAAPRILLMVGVNGSGKTTFLGKLANHLAGQGKKVLLVAGDTFRAGAAAQLAVWQQRSGTAIHYGKEGQDPASVIFDACREFIDGGYDHLLIDTAGRLQTKVNLLQELTKMRSVIGKRLPIDEVHTWLTVDTMLGQNSLQQARVFNETTPLTGLVLTKYDGTGKGGILFAISNELKVPVQYLTVGETITAFEQFNPETFVTELLSDE